MLTAFNVGDTVLVKRKVDSIYVDIDTTNGEPFYRVKIKGAGTHELYSIQVNEDVMKMEAENDK